MSKVILFIGVLCASFWLLYPTGGVPILAYHQVSEVDDIYSVTAGQFAEQMEYLAKEGYNAISLQELFAFYEGTGTLPPRPIVITFDDGYEDNYLTALPIMEKFQMKSTVFIVAGLVGTPEYLSWQQIAKMKQRQTEIGSHTLSHVALNSLAPEQQRYELLQSKKLLEQHIGPVNFLAYPYGAFSKVTEQMLRETGYLGACSGIPGLSHKEENLYALKRINIPHPKYGLLEFRLRLLRGVIYSKLGM